MTALAGAGSLRRRWRSWRFAPDVEAALPAWVAARLAVVIALVVANVVFDQLEPSSSEVRKHLHQGLMGWDAEWYGRIAAHGYRHTVVGLRFFPLFPLMARPIGAILAGHSGIAVVLLANVGALALGALLHRLALRETGDGPLARRATWLVAFAPPAFVLVWGYSESVAVALAVAFLLTVRGGRWWPAAALGVLGGMVRPSGILLTVPAAVEAARGLRSAPARELAARLAACASPAVGFAAYLSWVGIRFGDPLKPLKLQQRTVLRGKIADPLVTLWRGLHQLISGEFTRNALHVPWALFVIVVVVVVFRRWPASYGMYAAATLVVALATDRLGSLERYLFGCFPVILGMASMTWRPSAERLALVVGSAAMTGYGVLALLGAYVP